MRIARKLAGLVLLFFGITLVSFFVIHLAPGNTVDIKQDLNVKMTPEARQKMEKLYGLDKPIFTQYAQWLKRILKMDFGESFVDGERVLTKILRCVPVTLGINVLALLLIFSVGVWIGMWGAIKKDTATDHVITFFSLAGFSLPTFWLALILMSFFGVFLRILPVSGLHSLFYEELPPLERFADSVKHLLLPVLIASITGIASVSRYMRASMLHVLKQNYIRTAWAKGLSRKRVLYKHALKNALLPIVTLMGLSVPGLLGGSVLYESIFSIPGMGRLFYTSIFTRDYPVIMGVLVLGALLTLIGNLLADTAYSLADPRIRVQ